MARISVGGVVAVMLCIATFQLFADEKPAVAPKPLWTHKLGHFHPLGLTEDGRTVVLLGTDPAKQTRDYEVNFTLESRDARTGRLLHRWEPPKDYRTTMYLRIDQGQVRMLLLEDNAVLPRMPVYSWNPTTGKGRLHKFVGQHIVFTHFGAEAWFIKISPTPQGPRVTAYSFDTDEPVVENLLLPGFSPYTESQNLLAGGTAIAALTYDEKKKATGAAIADLKSCKITPVPSMEDGTIAQEFADTGIPGLVVVTFCRKDGREGYCFRLFDSTTAQWVGKEAAFLVPQMSIERYYVAGNERFATQVRLKDVPKAWRHLPGSNLEAEVGYALWYGGTRPPQPPVLLALPNGETIRLGRFLSQDRFQVMTEKSIGADGTFHGTSRIYNFQKKEWEGQREIKEQNPPYRAMGCFPASSGLTLAVSEAGELEAWEFAAYWRKPQ